VAKNRRILGENLPVDAFRFNPSESKKSLGKIIEPEQLEAA
jgi:hypothetical protein